MKTPKVSTTGAIFGKVIRIIDETHYIFNVGWKQGVSPGLRFVIYQESDDEIFDPDLEESLGKVEFVKGKVEIFHTQEKLAHARPYNEQNIDPSHAIEALLNIKPSPGYSRETITKLDVRISDIYGKPHIKPISVGDLVRSIES